MYLLVDVGPKFRALSIAPDLVVVGVAGVHVVHHHTMFDVQGVLVGAVETMPVANSVVSLDVSIPGR